MVLLFAACASQQPTPVVVGTQSGDSTTSSTADNPYGVAPCSTNTSPATDAPYIPPASTPAPTYNSGSTGTYTPSYAPVDIDVTTHTVVRDDTVYDTSKRYNITQDDLRTWNSLADDAISISQTLRVKPEGCVAPAVSTNEPSTPTTTTTAPVPGTPTDTPTVSAGSSHNVSDTTWQYPTTGSVIVNFSGSNKGVDIVGTQGQSAVTATDGKVVYVGPGLRGYGNLVIIQHNSSFLSAYGHSQCLLVSKNQAVKCDQTIAHMGNTGAPRTQLHFEIRQNGKPVNPTNHVTF